MSDCCLLCFKSTAAEAIHCAPYLPEACPARRRNQWLCGQLLQCPPTAYCKAARSAECRRSCFEDLRPAGSLIRTGSTAHTYTRQLHIIYTRSLHIIYTRQLCRAHSKSSWNILTASSASKSCVMPPLSCKLCCFTSCCFYKCATQWSEVVTKIK